MQEFPNHQQRFDNDYLDDSSMMQEDLPFEESDD